jgi:hypothetical protein
MEERRLTVLENRILKRISGPRGMPIESEESFTVKISIVFTVHLI